VPLYRQVSGFIAKAVEDGKLKPGDGLPSEGQLAEYMGVSVDTIREAFRVLRDQGVIETAVGIGSFIADRR
jgi:GntR family transcriptional regulator